MTRAKCEAKIAAHVEAIIDIVKEYNPECQYITFCYVEQDIGKSYYFENEHFDPKSPDADHPIHVFKMIEEE